MLTSYKISLTLLACLMAITPCFAQNSKPIKVKRIPASYDGATLIAIGTDGATSSATISNRAATVTPSTSTARLYIREDGGIAATIVGPNCKKKKNKCNKNIVTLSAKSGKSIKLGKDKGDGVLIAVGSKKKLKKTFKGNVKESKSAVSTAILSSGLASTSDQSLGVRRVKGLVVEELDADNDGLVSLVDSDDDGDGILDNYDDDNQLPGQNETEEQTEFPLFSNFKVSIDQTINLHATGIDTDILDSRLQSVQTLAIGVAGEDSETTELDCGELTYCSAGGTGTKLDGNSDFPGTAGGENDTDSDGLGEITKGSTGDFQLKTGASSSEIAGGDTLLQVITSDSDTRNATGMLNFVFNSSPAIKSLAVNEGNAETVDYEATNIRGSNNNCFDADATGDVSITIEGWRPQRPGESEAGEADYVDIGNSLITADIPNAPCVTSGSGGCSGSGPGNCAASSYSTTDTNLAVGNNGIEDGRGDIDAATSNTYTFTVDLSDCLANAQGGAIDWDAEETLFVDLQFRSSFGDNAAQKFCISRASS